MNAHTIIRDSEPVAGARERATGAIGSQLVAPVAFTLPTPPSVWKLYVGHGSKKRISAEYADWQRRALTAIRQQRPHGFDGPVIMFVGFERVTRGRADVDNRAKAVLDICKTAGLYLDDAQVSSLSLSWLPAANGMSHVRILPVQRIDAAFHPSQDGASGGWFFDAPFQQEENGHGDFAV